MRFSPGRHGSLEAGVDRFHARIDPEGMLYRVTVFEALRGLPVLPNGRFPRIVVYTGKAGTLEEAKGVARDWLRNGAAAAARAAGAA